MSTIRFYATAGPYGCFSNFSNHPFKLDGKRWPTSEHYFQAMKFAGTSHADAIRLASSPSRAKHLGRSRRHKLRADWESVKVGVMRKCLRAKFTQHHSARAVLLSTGNAKLIEAAPNDCFWGEGSKRTGRNMLGKLLMELRGELHNG